MILVARCNKFRTSPCPRTRVRENRWKIQAKGEAKGNDVSDFINRKQRKRKEQIFLQLTETKKIFYKSTENKEEKNLTNNRKQRKKITRKEKNTN